MQSRAWPPQQTRRSALFQQTTPTPPTRPPKPWPPARPRPSQRHPPSAPRRDTATGRDSQPAALGGSARDSEGPLSPSVADSRPANRAWACRSAHQSRNPNSELWLSDLDLDLTAVAFMLPVRRGRTANKEAATALAVPLQTSTSSLFPRSCDYWPQPSLD